MSSSTLEEVWALFREVAEAQKETAREFRSCKFSSDANVYMLPVVLFLLFLHKIADQLVSITEKFTLSKFQETARQIEATDRQIKQRDKG